MQRSKRATRRAQRIRWALFACAVVGLIGCKERLSAEEHQELSDLYRAIYLARQAPNSEKTAFAEDIGDVPCSRFCELQAICLNAHREHAKGIEKIESAKDAQSVQRRRMLLDDAEEQLKRAKSLVDACITHQADLQRKWR